MKIYLAAAYDRNPSMRTVRDVLESMGHKVTSRWVDQHNGRLTSSVSPEELNRTNGPTRDAVNALTADLQDVDDAETLISFTSGWSRKAKASGSLEIAGPESGLSGRHVEFGYAIAAKKRLIVCGQREHLFHAHPSVELVPNWDKLLIQLIKEMRAPVETGNLITNSDMPTRYNN